MIRAILIQGFEKRVNEFDAYLGLVVLARAVSIEVAVESVYQFQYLLGGAHADSCLSIHGIEENAGSGPQTASYYFQYLMQFL